MKLTNFEKKMNRLRKIKILIFLSLVLALSYNFINLLNIKKTVQKSPYKTFSGNNLRRNQNLENDEDRKGNNSKYSMNYDYMMNNNLGQYSSHLIVDQNNKTVLTIEVFVKLNYKYIKEFGGKENFSCLVKLTEFDELIELETFESPSLYSTENMKLIFHLILTDTKLNLKNILIAAIWKYDFNKSLDNEIFMQQNEFKPPLVLPYSLINYQIPSIITVVEPRSTSVSFCVHYTYAVPPQLINWFDFHLQFGVSEIMIYDGTQNRQLTKVLENNYGRYDSRIRIIPYYTEFDDLCSEDILFKQFENVLPADLKDSLSQLCAVFYLELFRDRKYTKGGHEKITANDCFSVLSRKYEFIGYYDLDEFVFPRSFNSLRFFSENSHSLSNYECTRLSSVCGLDPMTNDYNISSKFNENYLYNYLNSFVESKRNGRDRSKLVSIHFPHAVALAPNHVEKKLINDLGYLIKKIENSSNKTNLFPLNVFLSEPSNNKGHNFVIQHDDVDYIKYLYNSYNNSVRCFYEKYLNYAENIDSSLIRFAYFLTEANQRMGKKIHYYKNVKTIWIHYPAEVVTGIFLKFNLDALNEINFVKRINVWNLLINSMYSLAHKIKLKCEYLYL